MRPITYSWIGQCAAAPLVFLASAWILGVFHSYRRHWLSVDIFLLAISAQELLMALQVFIFSLLSLVQPDLDGACAALVWSLNATRALQLATVVSLLADRALTCHWPYRYRFSVRRHQLRYHLAVLAAMAALLGVAALIARPQQPPSFPGCSTMPHLLHVRLALFLLAVYGALLLVGAISTAVVQTNRGCGGSSSSESSDLTHHVTNTTSSTASSNKPPGSMSSCSSIHGRPLQTSASTASSTSSSGIGTRGGLRPASSTADLLPTTTSAASRPSVLRSSSNSSPGGSDFRWTTSVSVAVICCCVNHIPYLALTALGTFAPRLLPSWPTDNLSLWLSLAEGALLPLVLLLADAPFRRGAGASCSRKTGAPTPSTNNKFQDGEGPFRLFPKEEVKAFPLTNGSLFSSLLTLPVDPSSGGSFQPSCNYKKEHGLGMRMGLPPGGLRGLDLRRLGGGTSSQLYGASSQPYGAPYYCRDTAGSLSSLANISHDPLYSDPTNKSSSVDSSLKEDHIYATLSETFGSMSSFSDGYLNDDNRCPSVTTVANDDFEFHDPRSSGCSGVDLHSVGRNPCTRQQSCSGSSFSSASGLPSFGMRGRDDDTLVLHSACNPNVGSRPPADLPPEAYSQIRVVNSSDEDERYMMYGKTDPNLVLEKNRQNMMNCIKEEPPAPVHNSVQIGGYDNMVFESDTLEKKYYMQKHSHDSLESTNTDVSNYKIKHGFSKESIVEGTLSRKHRISSLSMNDLDRFDKPKESDPEEQMMFLLPVKSESMLSLYRLYLAEDEQESSASLHYSIELSKSENDLSVVNEEHESLSIGRSTEDLHQAPHEIYQKRRRPQSSASKIRRQHKIQRAKGLHMKNRPVQLPQTPGQTNTTGAPTEQSTKPTIHSSTSVSGVTNMIDGAPHGGGEVQVAIMDKARRQNGIITIRDPSGLSVQELFSVLNRATTGAGSARRSKDEHSAPPSSLRGVAGVTTIEVPDSSYQSYMGATEPASLPCAPSGSHQHEFKKIFVSEYL